MDFAHRLRQGDLCRFCFRTFGVRERLVEINPEQQSFGEVQDLETWISDEEEWQREHLAARIFVVFAGLRWCWRLVGLYSVVSYSAAQRTSEFGIRIARGAGRRHVLGLYLRRLSSAWGAGSWWDWRWHWR